MHQIKRAKLKILCASILVSAVIFFLHGFFKVRSLKGQCCGYEGDPGVLALFFLMWPGPLYLLGLSVILLAKVWVLNRLSTER